MVVIGEEIASDAPAIRQLNEEAFGQPEEAISSKGFAPHAITCLPGRRTGRAHRVGYPL